MKTVTGEVLEQEVRFLLKTLMRDDLFGDEITLPEAERLLDSSLTLPFAEYCAFLTKNNFIGVERTRNLVLVLEGGERLARGEDDDVLRQALQQFFTHRITASNPSASSSTSMPASGADKSPGGKVPTTQFINLERHDRYTKKNLIGEGTVGHVFHGFDAILQRPVVLKVMDHIFAFVTYIDQDELRGRLRKATLSQAQLRHPHVLPVIDFDFEQESPEVVFAASEGGSLRDRMGKTPVDVALVWVAQIAHALGHAHERGVVHGGVKPENVLFDAYGNVQLTDFGLSAVSEKGTETGPPVYVGTGNTSYMAPEQLRGGGPSPASDVYALGLLLYELLCGELPGRRSPLPSEVNDKVPAAVDAIFDQMCMDKVEQRYAHGRDVAQALVDAVDGMDQDRFVLFSKDPVPPAAPSLPAADAPDATGANGKSDPSGDDQFDPGAGEAPGPA